MKWAESWPMSFPETAPHSAFAFPSGGMALLFNGVAFLVNGMALPASRRLQFLFPLDDRFHC